VNDSISDEEFEKNWKKWTKTDSLHSQSNQGLGAITDSFLYRVCYLFIRIQ